MTVLFVLYTGGGIFGRVTSTRTPTVLPSTLLDRKTKDFVSLHQF